ncbi:MAG: hypothetical protein WCZ43_11240 [Proteiniphilum sp.]
MALPHIRLPVHPVEAVKSSSGRDHISLYRISHSFILNLPEQGYSLPAGLYHRKATADYRMDVQRLSTS